MNFKRSRRVGRQASAVELTPLIDVVFLLLIFFMVSTTFSRESALEVELPMGKGSPLEPMGSDIAVQVNAAGEYAVNDRMLADAGLATLLAALAEVEGAGRVVVAADAHTPHQAVVRVLDAAGRLGLTRIRIATQAPQEPASREAEDAER